MTTGWKFYRLGTRFIEMPDPTLCQGCGGAKSFCRKHDRYYCEPCSIWLEGGNGKCPSCWRPPRRQHS